MNTTTLRKLYSALGELSRVDNAMPFHQVMVLLLIALHDNEGGIEMRDISASLKMSSSSASRNVAALGEWHRLQRPGLGLVETTTDYEDRRRKPVVLTTKGRKLLDTVTRRLS